ncbi:MAG: DNA alkylation repair protein [Planctomycetes bacterium]|nr:DNA alkylation repair protein [Planctomycetota bacterium]
MKYAVEEALTWLKDLASKKVRDEMGPRYGIHAPKAFGIRMAEMQRIAKGLGRDHDLAAALWKTGWYEARTVAAFVDDPERVTPAQMDRWCADFDNWAICDTVCFHLFDRTPHALPKVAKWSRLRGEFQKRAAFALLASVALHDRSATDDALAKCLPLVEKAASDDRNFVKKALSWALRSVGRRSAKLRAAATAVARRLAASPEPAPRWVGKDALRDLAKQR